MAEFGLSDKTRETVRAILATCPELEKAMVTAAKSPRLVAAIEKLEFDSAVLNSVDLSRQLKADFERWGPVIKATGYTADK